jgi:hypothetical protein
LPKLAINQGEKMSESGWVKTHRRKIKWEWFSTPNTAHFFEYCLLKASHKEFRYKGKVIPRGGFWFGRKVASTETGLSERSIRTAIKHLISTNEVTIKTSSQGSIITVVNWDKYQLVTNDVTNDRPTTDQRPTTYKNYNNINNINNNPKASSQTFDLEQIYSAYPKKQGKKKGIEKLLKLIKTQEQFDLILQGAKSYSEYCSENNTDSKYIKQFSTWVNGEHWNDELETNKNLEEELIRRLEAL